MLCLPFVCCCIRNGERSETAFRRRFGGGGSCWWWLRPWILDLELGWSLERCCNSLLLSLPGNSRWWELVKERDLFVVFKIVSFVYHQASLVFFIVQQSQLFFFAKKFYSSPTISFVFPLVMEGKTKLSK